MRRARSGECTLRGAVSTGFFAWLGVRGRVEFQGSGLGLVVGLEQLGGVTLLYLRNLLHLLYLLYLRTYYSYYAYHELEQLGADALERVEDLGRVRVRVRARVRAKVRPRVRAS